MGLDERLNNAPCGYLSIGHDGTVLEVNKTLARALDYAERELRGRNIRDLLPVGSLTFYHSYLQSQLLSKGSVSEVFLALKSRAGNEVPALVNAARRVIGGVTVTDWIVIAMHVRADYEARIIEASKRAEAAAANARKVNDYLAQAHKELEEKQRELLLLNERLRRMVVTDQLTGLKNRYTFEESLHERVEISHRTPVPLSLLLIDVDHFKRVNDTLGHQAGDKVLQQAAQILSRESREVDVVARYGGEEFAVILPDADRNRALLAAERLRKSIETADWTETPITVSIGAAVWEPDDDEESLLRKADEALYSAKNSGRNRVSAF